MRWGAVIGLAALCLAVGWPRIASLAGGWLLTGEEPRPSDLIVVLAGGARERLLTALELYRMGAAPAIMITDMYGYPDAMMRELALEGVPLRALVPPPRAASSSLEDALSIREVVIRQELRSVIVVTSPFHCRRARLILSRTLSDLDVRLTVAAARSLYVDPNRWWESREGWGKVPLEYAKLLKDWLLVPSFGDAGPGSGEPEPAGSP